MKRTIAFYLAVSLVLTVLTAGALAAPSRVLDSGLDSGVDIAVSGGKSIQLRGHIEPTIISVTMPSYIPFDISKSLTSPNKVVSPRIEVANHSNVPVGVVVDYASVDLSRLNGVSWSNDGRVGPMQIGVGFNIGNEAPLGLSAVSWLQKGEQNTHLVDISARGEEALYLAGDIGLDVPENKTFTVTPTLVVRTGH